MSAGLSKAKIEELRKLLAERLRVLHDEVRQELEAAGHEQYVDLLNGVHDTGDESIADALADMNLAVIDRHIIEIRAVEDALARIRDERFGACIDCHDDIPYERLQANPTAIRCRDCQERHERAYEGGGTRTI